MCTFRWLDKLWANPREISNDKMAEIFIQVVFVFYLNLFKYTVLSEDTHAVITSAKVWNFAFQFNLKTRFVTFLRSCNKFRLWSL